MSPAHDPGSHSTLQDCAVHVMSCWHDWYAHLSLQLDPPHAIVPVHSLAPPSVQSMSQLEAWLQSMLPHER